jgi:hypothetical protein
MLVRDPNESNREVQDADEIIAEKMLHRRKWVLAREAQLLNERKRVNGLDSDMLSRQVLEKEAIEAAASRIKESERIQMMENVARYHAEVNDHITKEGLQKREYASFLENQITEKREIVNETTPDFDANFLVGHQHDDAVDAVRNRVRCKLHSNELLSQMEERSKSKNLNKEPCTSPLQQSSNCIQKRQMELAKRNAAFNQNLVTAKTKSTREPHRDHDGDHLYLNTIPHTRATDYKGMTRDQVKAFLSENESVLVSKQTRIHESDLADREYYMKQKLRLEDENKKAEMGATARREMRIRCDEESRKNSACKSTGNF